MKFRLPAFLFLSAGSLWPYMLKTMVIAEAPSWLCNAVIVMAYSDGLSHSTPPTLRPAIPSLFSLVLAAPALETFALAGLASLLLYKISNSVVIAIIIGLILATISVTKFDIDFLYSIWRYFISVLAFLNWRKKSFWHGYIAAMVPIMFHYIQWRIFASF